MKEGTAGPSVKVARDAPEPEESRYRQLNGFTITIAKIIGIGLGIFFLLYVGGVFPAAGFYLLFFQLNGIFMGGVLTLTFMMVPAYKKERRDRIPWHDYLLILFSLSGSVYVIANAMDIMRSAMLSATTVQMVLGVLALLALFEALRRTVGWAMVIILLAFILHAKYSYLFPDAPFTVAAQTWDGLMAVIYLSFEGMYGSLTTLADTVIFLFVLFGVFFMKARGGEVFMNVALSLTGRMRGGPAKAAVVGSGLFGSIASSPAANVAVTGSLTIPLMKKMGYSGAFAGAVEAVASTGGQITPPVMGSIAFVMAALLRVSYATIAIAAILPAILYYLSLFMQVHFRAVKLGLRGLPASELPSFWKSVKGGWEFGIAAVLMVALLFVYRYPPETAAAYSVVAVIVISMFRKANRLSFRNFLDAFYSSSRTMIIIAPAVAAGGIITGLVGMTGLGPQFATDLVKVSGGNAFLLFVLSGLACFVIGMGASLWISYILLAALVAPALQVLGVPLLVSHFFIYYMATSMYFTPPYAPCAFISAGFAKVSAMSIGVQSVRLGIVAYLVPFILVYDSSLLLIGTPLGIAFSMLKAAVAVIALSVGFERCLFKHATWAETALAIVGGIALIVPAWQAYVVGIVLLALMVVLQLTRRGEQFPGQGLARAE